MLNQIAAKGADKKPTETLPIPKISIYGRPAHEMRIMPVSPRAFETPSGTVRVNQELPSSVVIDPTDIDAANTLARIYANKKETRILNFQQSGIGTVEYTAMTTIAAHNRSYILCRPVNPEVANARLLCMLLGTEVVTKAMGVYQKSSKTPFSGGFLRVNATKIADTELDSLSAHFPSLKRTVTSLRELEKAGEFYDIKLDIPLSFIFSLHAQNRIKDPIVEKVGDDWYIKAESNDKVGVIKWRCKLITAETPHSEERPLSETEIYNTIPDWFYTLYFGTLRKAPEESDFKGNRQAFLLAELEYKEKLTAEAILQAWRSKLETIPEWFSKLQAEHPELGLKWDVTQIYNVQELKDGEYRDIVILGRKDSAGNTVPLIADYDLFAVLPDWSMTDEEIWELQQKAGVSPRKMLEILRRNDNGDVTEEDLTNILLPKKFDTKQYHIDREMYFGQLIELGPMTVEGPKDSRVRYKYNSLTGFSTRAEGDLIAVFNQAASEYAEKYAAMMEEAVESLKRKVITARTSSAGATGMAHDETPTATTAKANEKKAKALSAHHGAETANPKREPLPWELPVEASTAGIFTCDVHGDFCLIKTKEDFILFCKNVIANDKLYGTHHRIPLNANWPIELRNAIRHAIGDDNVIEHNGAQLLHELEQARVKARTAALRGITASHHTTPEKLDSASVDAEDADAEAVNSSRLNEELDSLTPTDEATHNRHARLAAPLHLPPITEAHTTSSTSSSGTSLASAKADATFFSANLPPGFHLTSPPSGMGSLAEVRPPSRLLAEQALARSRRPVPTLEDLRRAASTHPVVARPVDTTTTVPHRTLTAVRVGGLPHSSMYDRSTDLRATPTRPQSQIASSASRAESLRPIRTGGVSSLGVSIAFSPLATPMLRSHATSMTELPPIADRSRPTGISLASSSSTGALSRSSLVVGTTRTTQRRGPYGFHSDVPARPHALELRGSAIILGAAQTAHGRTPSGHHSDAPATGRPE